MDRKRLTVLITAAILILAVSLGLELAMSRRPAAPQSSEPTSVQQTTAATEQTQETTDGAEAETAAPEETAAPTTEAPAAEATAPATKATEPPAEETEAPEETQSTMPPNMLPIG